MSLTSKFVIPVLIASCYASQAFAFDFFRSAMGCLTMGGVTTTGALVANSLASKTKNLDVTALATSAMIGCVVGGVLTESIAARAEREAEATLRVENSQLRSQYIHYYQALCLIEKRCSLSAIPFNPKEIPLQRELSDKEKHEYSTYSNTGTPVTLPRTGTSPEELTPIGNGN